MEDRFTVSGDDDDPEHQFVQVPNEFFRAPGLSHGARVLFCLLKSYQGDHATAWPRHKTLAQAMQCNPRTISRLIAELRERGCILVETISGGSNHYRCLNARKHPHVAAYIASVSTHDSHVVPSDPRHDKICKGPTTAMSWVYKEDTEKNIQQEEEESRARSLLVGEDRLIDVEHELAMGIAAIFGVQHHQASVATIKRKVAKIRAKVPPGDEIDFLELAHDCYDWHLANGTDVKSWPFRYGTWLENRVKPRLTSHDTSMRHNGRSNGVTPGNHASMTGVRSAPGPEGQAAVAKFKQRMARQRDERGEA